MAKELASVKRGGILKGEAGIRKRAKDLSFDDARKKLEAWADASKKSGTARGMSATVGGIVQRDSPGCALPVPGRETQAATHS